ncbi:hypothetical protein D9M72_605950 [compost metagenome]
MGEARPGGHPVDTGHLIDRLVDVLHRRQVEDHVVAGPAPGDGDDDEHLRPEGMRQPRDRRGDDADRLKRRVDDAVEREHAFEQHRIGDERGDAGQEDGGAEEAAADEPRIVEQ